MALIFSLMILGQAYFVRRYVGTWLFPACLFGLFWFCLTFFPLIVLFNVPINPLGVGFILLCLAAFSSSALIFPWQERLKENILKRETTLLVFQNPFLKRTFYVLSSVTTLCIVLDSLAQGVSLHDLVYNLITTAASYRNLVSFGDLNVTMYGRLGDILIYDVSILGGMLISSTPTRWGRFRIIMCSFTPGVLMAVAQSTKWALFSSIAFFYGGVLTYQVAQSDFRLFKKGIFKKLILCFAILVLVTAVSFMSRGLQDSDDSTLIHDRLTLMFASYSCGHLYAFSDWYGSYMAANWDTGYQSQIRYQQDNATYGATYGVYTFAPVARFLGSTKAIPPDTFDDYYEYGNLIVSNIYTIFRGLIQDFGVGGCLLFMFLTGLLNHWSFNTMLRNRKPVLTVATFIFFIGFYYASFGRSLFSWSGIYFSFVVLCAILAINKRLSLYPKESASSFRTGSV
ncbi:MAG TPA: hypothetical protein VNE63_08020 [Candidatus Acidoferrales bacterium]|nr:hypothetical protein [Candidatus Acidoferrales bacterium]